MAAVAGPDRPAAIKRLIDHTRGHSASYINPPEWVKTGLCLGLNAGLITGTAVAWGHSPFGAAGFAASLYYSVPTIFSSLNTISAPRRFRNTISTLTGQFGALKSAQLGVNRLGPALLAIPAVFLSSTHIAQIGLILGAGALYGVTVAGLLGRELFTDIKVDKHSRQNPQTTRAIKAMPAQ